MPSLDMTRLLAVLALLAGCSTATSEAPDLTTEQAQTLDRVEGAGEYLQSVLDCSTGEFERSDTTVLQIITVVGSKVFIGGNPEAFEYEGEGAFRLEAEDGGIYELLLKPPDGFGITEIDPDTETCLFSVLFVPYE